MNIDIKSLQNNKLINTITITFVEITNIPIPTIIRFLIEGMWIRSPNFWKFLILYMP